MKVIKQGQTMVGCQGLRVVVGSLLWNSTLWQNKMKLAEVIQRAVLMRYQDGHLAPVL